MWELLTLLTMFIYIGKKDLTPSKNLSNGLILENELCLYVLFHIGVGNHGYDARRRVENSANATFENRWLSNLETI